MFQLRDNVIESTQRALHKPVQSDKMNGWSLTHLFFVLLFMIAVDASQVTLTNNGYNTLVVAISHETPVSQSEKIIGNIQKMISDASPVLYKATGDRLYFKSVHILIPESWDNINADFSTWETFNAADVIVDTPNPLHEDTPYTQHKGKCGEKGVKIHLTPNYVATLYEEQNGNQYGKPGKVFVHEWAHYRYGVFDEYGTAGGKYPLFYRKAGSTSIVPNICSNNPAIFTARDITTNGECQKDPINTEIYDENCRFELSKHFVPVTSLTSYHQLDSVVHFCKDDQEHAHMTDAPNEHNAKCGGASTWSVIMKNPDFAENKNKNNKALKMMPTEFKIVKMTGSRFVVVMDVSGSMKDFDRIGKLGESVRSWIKNNFPSGNELAMVKFSSSAQIVSELKIISDTNSREEMMGKVPKNLGVATCIGCGLELAIQMLKEGGIIVLVTDGKNSLGYLDISDVKEDIKKAAIRVVTVAFGKEADPNIEILADLTGGKSYFIKDEDSSEALQQAFSGASTLQSSVKNDDLIFKLLEKNIGAKESKTNFADVVEVDSTVGRNLKLSVFNLDNKESVKSIELTGPDGKVTRNFEFDTSTATVTVALAQSGRWAINVNLKSPQSKPITITVTTQSLPNEAAPITTECTLPKGADIRNANDKKILIEARVWKGSHPVTGALIKAYIVKPNDEVDILKLLDDGVNADNTKDDGVYSKYYIGATQPGRYTVKCQVASNNKALERLGFIGSENPQLFGDEKRIEDDEGIPMENFTRITSGGSFQVEIPVSSDDSYPPGEVTDLSVMLVNDTATNVSIALKWTAPGDDLDEGTVSYYELKYSDVVADVMDSNFDDESPIRKSRSIITEDNRVDGSLQPNEAGALQMATFQLTDVEQEKPYYLSLRAVDKAGKAGQVSNLVVFFIPDKSALVMTRNSEDEYWGVATDQDIHIHISSNKEPSYHVSSVLVAAFGLILIASLAVTLLMAVVKQTQVYRSYDGIPA